MTHRDGPPRAVLAAAIAVAVGAVVAVVVIAANRDAAPVPISAVPAPQAESPDCARLTAALPERLGDYKRAQAADPAPIGAAAWVAEPAADPVILRCGLDRPADFVQGSPIQMVDDVSWFQVTEADRSTWFAVDRVVYVALTLPQDSGPTPIQVLSEVIGRTLPARQIEPAPPR